ncbi:hypothetical protein BGX38DRAFT_1277440 [Terfezia claveryi]|nr:hypothetical protein BGX38DRAFT_1277440 [Terfezia claveryi]
MEEFTVKIHDGSEMRDGAKGERDISHENLLLFVRLAVQFVGLYKATRHGDVGVMQCVMDLLGPEFLGAKQHKYAWELFEVGCGFKKEWSRELQNVVKWNWVINVTGDRGIFLLWMSTWKSWSEELRLVVMILVQGSRFAEYG